MMTGREKLYFLLERIEAERERNPSGQPIRIHPVQNLHSKYHTDELIRLLTRLEKDLNVLRIIGLPGTSGGYGTHEQGYVVIELLPAFLEYYAHIQSDPVYQEFTGKRPPARN